jgi:NAD(P)-dependent dehydrogenase (short-subunit alcohol dehydrogenase family)
MQFNKDIKAIVTGGVSGLGLAVTRGIIAAGGQVAMLDINEDAGREMEDELGERAAFYKADVTSEDGITGVVEQAADDMGGVNVTMNCAGILGAGRVLGKEGPMPLSTFEGAVKVNLIGSFNVAKATANLMQNNKPNEDGERGVIVNTASVAAYEGQIGQAAYSASKGGVVGMTLPMAREFTRFGVRVMTIAPGVFITPMVEGMPEKVQQSLGEAVPFPQRLGKPSEFADLVRHIVENPYLNGSTIRLDGAIRLQPK